MTEDKLDLVPLSDLINAIARRSISYAIVILSTNNNKENTIYTYWDDKSEEWELLGYCSLLKRYISDAMKEEV